MVRQHCLVIAHPSLQRLVTQSTITPPIHSELMWLENPAFYTAVFILCPVVILVAGAATGVIPGFVAQPTTYSTLEEVKNSYSYGDLTSAAQYASGATSLF